MRQEARTESPDYLPAGQSRGRVYVTSKDGRLDEPFRQQFHGEDPCLAAYCWTHCRENKYGVSVQSPLSLN